LKESEEGFFKAFQSSPDAIIITRLTDGKLVEVNQGFSLLTGYLREEALGSSTVAMNLWAEPQDRERCAAALREEKGVRNLEFSFRTKCRTAQCHSPGPQMPVHVRLHRRHHRSPGRSRRWRQFYLEAIFHEGPGI
jgi:PAS domain S-box-containing protein